MSMEIVVLGIKSKTKPTQYQVYDGSYPLIKNNQTPVPNNEQVFNIKKLSVYPFDTFSSLDFENNKRVDWTKWDPCYLTLKSALTQSQWNRMRSGNIRSVQFSHIDAVFLGECHTPKQYFLEILQTGHRGLSSYDATTWVIKEPCESLAEQHAMEEMLRIDYHHDHELDLDWVPTIVPYLPFIMDNFNLDDDHITFGQYGRINRSQAMFNQLAPVANHPKFLELLQLAYYKFEILPYVIKAPFYTDDMILKTFLDTPQHVKEYLATIFIDAPGDFLEAIKGSSLLEKLPMETLIDQHFKMAYQENESDLEEYGESYKDIFRNKNYQPKLVVYDDWDPRDDWDDYNDYDDYDDNDFFDYPDDDEDDDDSYYYVDWRVETLAHIMPLLDLFPNQGRQYVPFVSDDIWNQAYKEYQSQWTNTESEQ